MHPLTGIFHNHVLFAGLIGWFAAQALKIPIHYFFEKEWDFSRFHGSGGMPSSHTAMSVAATVLAGALHGFDCALFGLGVIFTSVIMYDATGVRRETGRQATIINQIVDLIHLKGKHITDMELKELVGHTLPQVLVGAVLGSLIGISVMWI